MSIRTESESEIRRMSGWSLHVRTYVRTDERTYKRTDGSDVLTPSVCIPKIDGVTANIGGGR